VQVERNTRHGYTLDAVRSALDGAAGTLGTPAEFSAWDCFVGYVVLDAIVANTDRRIENWAVINAGERRIAPSFDHASSLGFALFDGDRLDRLTSADPNFRVSGWTERARSRFQGKPHPRAVASQALDMVNPRVKRHWMERVDALGDPLNLW